MSSELDPDGLLKKLQTGLMKINPPLKAKNTMPDTDFDTEISKFWSSISDLLNSLNKGNVPEPKFINSSLEIEQFGSSRNLCDEKEGFCILPMKKSHKGEKDGFWIKFDRTKSPTPLRRDTFTIYRMTGFPKGSYAEKFNAVVLGKEKSAICVLSNELDLRKEETIIEALKGSIDKYFRNKSVESEQSREQLASQKINHDSQLVTIGNGSSKRKLERTECVPPNQVKYYKNKPGEPEQSQREQSVSQESMTNLKQFHFTVGPTPHMESEESAVDLWHSFIEDTLSPGSFISDDFLIPPISATFTHTTDPLEEKMKEAIRSVIERIERKMVISIEESGFKIKIKQGEFRLFWNTDSKMKCIAFQYDRKYPLTYRASKMDEEVSITSLEDLFRFLGLMWKEIWMEIQSTEKDIYLNSSTKLQISKSSLHCAYVKKHHETLDFMLSKLSNCNNRGKSNYDIERLLESAIRDDDLELIKRIIGIFRHLLYETLLCIIRRYPYKSNTFKQLINYPKIAITEIEFRKLIMHTVKTKQKDLCNILIIDKYNYWDDELEKRLKRTYNKNRMISNDPTVPPQQGGGYRNPSNRGAPMPNSQNQGGLAPPDSRPRGPSVGASGAPPGKKLPTPPGRAPMTPGRASPQFQQQAGEHLGGAAQPSADPENIFKQFVEAAAHGNMNVIKEMLQCERATKFKGVLSEAFLSASRNGHSGVVMELIEKGIDPSIQDNKALRIASKNGHLDVVKILLKDERVDPSAKGSQAIISLIQRKVHDPVIPLLLDQGFKFTYDVLLSAVNQTDVNELNEKIHKHLVHSHFNSQSASKATISNDPGDYLEAPIISTRNEQTWLDGWMDGFP